MTQVAEKPPIDEVVEHFGTKGMHWGVRNNKAIAKTQNTVDRLHRVANGKTVPGDMMKTVSGVGRNGLGGIIGVKTAGRHADKLQARIDQAKSGQKSARSVLESKGNISASKTKESALSTLGLKKSDVIMTGLFAAIVVGAKVAGNK